MDDRSLDELSTQLLQFYEELTDFQADCSFLCEAITSMTSEEEFTDEETAIGIARFSHLIKARSKDLKQELKDIYVKAYTQEQALPPRDKSGHS